MATLAVLGALWIAPGFFGGMHDSDQAAVLGDAWRIASGAAREAGEYYNYDKLFFTDWVLAGLFWLMRQLGFTDIVRVGNLSCSLLLSVAIVVVQATARLRARSYLALCAVLLAPTFVLHVAYMAPAFFSAAFLLLLSVVMQRTSRGGKAGIWLAMALLTFAAVGSRADAVLALPFLLWLHVPLGRKIWNAWRDRRVFAVAVGVIAAFGVSKILQEAPAFYSHEPVIDLKVLAAYVVFGIGGAVPISALLWVQMGTRFLVRNSPARWNWLLGAALLLIPFGFYSLQLFSTRYWTLGLVCLLMLVVSRRGQVLLERGTPRLLSQAAFAVALLWAVLPLALGAVLPNPRMLPLIVLRDATVFPSADGMISMGAYVAHLYEKLEADPGSARDHNEAIWRAAQEATYHPDATGRVPAVITPMYSILRLAMLLQGHQPQAYRLFELPAASYVDTRSLIKSTRPLGPQSEDEDLLGKRLRASIVSDVSTTHWGVGIHRIDMSAEPIAPRPVWEVLRRLFAGDDFWPREGVDVWKQDRILRAQFGRGAMIVVVSRAPFRVEVTARDGTTRVVGSEADTTFPQWQVFVLSGAATDVSAVRLLEGNASEFFSGEAFLPDYMSQRRNH